MKASGIHLGNAIMATIGAIQSLLFAYHHEGPGVVTVGVIGGFLAGVAFMGFGNAFVYSREEKRGGQNVHR